MPRILIDVTRLMYRRVTGTLPTGIDRVSQEYVRHYGATGRAVLSLGPFSVVLSKEDSEAVFHAACDQTVPARALAARVGLKAFLWRWLALAVRGDTLINTGHYGLENARYGWWLRRQGARVIVVVHDLIPITHPEFCRPREHRKHLERMACAARVCAGVVANSAHTLEEFHRFCRSRALQAPPSAVARLGPGLIRTSPGARPIEAPYFVILGTIEPRKNHGMLLQLWRRLSVALGDAAPKLVVIGQRGWGCENVVDLLERCAPLKGVVIEQRRCTDAQLVTWLHHARALLFPSFAEGYGLPATEALLQGVPVIASELPVFRETLGDVPEYAAPLDAPRWEQLVRDYTPPESERRAAQVARMAAFRPSTWAQHFAVVDALLARVDREGSAERRCAA